MFKVILEGRGGIKEREKKDIAMSSFPHPFTPPPPSPPPKINCNLVLLKTLTKKSNVKQHKYPI